MVFSNEASSAIDAVKSAAEELARAMTKAASIGIMPDVAFRPLVGAGDRPVEYLPKVKWVVTV